jgi:peptidoglycan/xylan/chitin deacetylase (PgdA/CDA1 family)
MIRVWIIITVTLISLAIAGVTACAMAMFSNLTGVGIIISLLIAFVMTEGLLLYGIFDRRAPIFGKIFSRGAKNLHAISITFDDGPNEPYTCQLLDILRDFNVMGTFFVVGENTEMFPEAVKRAVAQGHEVGNHGYDHGVLALRSPGYILHQIRKTSDLIDEIAGVRPKVFRAPHGWRNPWLNWAAKAAGCIPVAWSLGVWDTDRPGADVIAQRSLKGVHDGCILLLHDGRGTEHGTDCSQLVQALPIILRELKQEGYEFLTVSEMIKATPQWPG